MSVDNRTSAAQSDGKLGPLPRSKVDSRLGVGASPEPRVAGPVLGIAADSLHLDKGSRRAAVASRLDQRVDMHARTQACLDLGKAFAAHCSPRDAKAAAKEITDRLQPGGRLQLGRQEQPPRMAAVSRKSMQLLCLLTPSQWQAVFADTLGIATINVPIDSPQLVETLCERVQRLQTVDRFEVDLSELHHFDPEEQEVYTTVFLDVTRREGVAVQARNWLAPPSIFKPLLRTVDRNGRTVGEAVALPGVPYYAPDAPAANPPPGERLAARNVLQESRLGKARFKDPEGAIVRGEAPPIWCRHIAVHWLIGVGAQFNRPLQAPAGSAAHDRAVLRSIAPYESADSIAASVPASIDDVLRTTRSDGPHALFRRRAWGEYLESQFDQMRPGEARFDHHGSSGHDDAEMLLVLPGPEADGANPQYVLTHFETNFGCAILVNESPQDFRSLNLANWMCFDPDFPRSKPLPEHMTFLTRWPTRSAVRTEPLWVPEASGAIGWNAQLALLEAGGARDDSKLMTKLLQQASHRKQDERLEDIGLAFFQLMEAGDPSYRRVQAALLDGKHRLSADRRVDLLGYCSRSKELGPDRSDMVSPLWTALHHGHADHAGAFATDVCDEAGVLSKSDKLELLLSENDRTGEADLPTPALHDVCNATGLWEYVPEVRPRQHDAIYRFLSVVLRSRTLGDGHQGRIIAAVAPDKSTAAEAAMSSANAAAAAAIVCAILESPADRPTKMAWLAECRLAKDAGGIEKLLLDALAGEPPHVARDWPQRVVNGFLKLRVDSKASEAAAGADVPAVQVVKRARTMATRRE